MVFVEKEEVEESTLSLSLSRRLPLLSPFQDSEVFVRKLHLRDATMVVPAEETNNTKSCYNDAKKK